MAKKIKKESHEFERVVKENCFMVFKVREENWCYYDYWALAPNKYREVVVTNLRTGEGRAIHTAWTPYAFTLDNCADFILGVINKNPNI